MKDLTTGNEGKLIWQFAMPMLLGNIFHQLYNVVDSWVVGNYLGKEALSAVGASHPLIFLMISLVIGVSMGSTIIISQYFGAKDYNKVKISIDTLYIIMFFSAITVTIIGLLFSREIFQLIKLPEEVIPSAVSYFNIYITGSIFMFGFYGTSAILQGMGDSKTPLVFLIISTVMNILLDLLFVLQFDMGVEGAAWATVLAQAGALFSAIFYLNRTHKLIRISFLRLTFDWEVFKTSVRIGIPSGLQQVFVSLGMLALFRIVNDFGTSAVAAYSVASRIDSFAIVPAMTFASALGTFVGQNMGAGKHERVKSGLIKTLTMTGIISVIISASVIIFAHSLVSFFTKDLEVIAIGAEYLQIVGYFYIVFAGMFTFTGVFRGSGDTLIPMFITLFSLWLIRVPASIFFAKVFGLVGVWYGVPAAWITGLLMSILYFAKGNWKSKVVVKRPLETAPAAFEEV
ncbi:MAG: MATE family efflux transporter [Bacteroidales bacterium]|nr:MATE family efflux transporter [Bacteroidales bacterium]